MDWIRNIIDACRRAARRVVRRAGRTGQADFCGSAVVDGLQVRCDRALPPESVWNALRDGVSTATGFEHYAWQRAIARCFVREGGLRVVGVFEAERPLLLLPLQLSSGRALESAGGAVCDYIDPLVHPAHRDRAWRCALKFLRWRWDPSVELLALDNLPDESPSRAAIEASAADAGLECVTTSPAPVVRVALPQSLEAFYAQVSANDRSNMRRRIRKIEADGKGRLAACSSEPELMTSLQRVIGYMECRGGEKGLAARRHVGPLLLDAAADMFRSGDLNVYTLYINEAPAAGIVVFRSPRGHLYYNSGFDPAFGEWRPGIAVCMMLLRQTIDEGAQVFDMLRGQEPYKYALGGKDSPLWRCVLRPR
jgi:CelD/BcsL family acetyltransferase involved in cellulose biosynthesis